MVAQKCTRKRWIKVWQKVGLSQPFVIKSVKTGFFLNQDCLWHPKSPFNSGRVKKSAPWLKGVGMTTNVFDCCRRPLCQYNQASINLGIAASRGVWSTLFTKPPVGLFWFGELQRAEGNKPNQTVTTYYPHSRGSCTSLTECTCKS